MFGPNVNEWPAWWCDAQVAIEIAQREQAEIERKVRE
jgi:hypothetical protein